MSCGLSLSDDALAGARQARLSAAVPAPLVEKMRAAKLTGERKPVTALFADVVGSTSLAERMDPEDWTQMMNEAFDLMSRAIFRYEGTIAQLQGDALLAFFGAPVAHEDDPERAVRAALDMIRATDEFTAQLKAARGIDFRIRAGINTGPVIVGNVGSDLRYEYTALGDAVNVAARVETAAQPGQVLITAQTQRFVASAFEFDDLGEVGVKGKAEPLHLYHVLGLRAEPGRRRGLEAIGLSSPLVGRSAELETLRGVFEVVRAGRGRLAVLLGEPGIGKSRLLAELKDAIGVGTDPGGPVAWIEGRCVSYGRTIPYHLVFDLVRSMLELPQTGVDVLPRDVLDERLAALLGDEATDVAGYVAHLLGMPLSRDETDRVQLDPETLQGRYVAALSRIVRQIAQERPVVLVCEDIHWADPASVEIMLQLLPLLTPMPVLTLFCGRAETDAPGWKLVAQPRAVFADALTEVRLQPLNESDSRELVANLLEIESLPESVRQAILTRSEGNPFFVEEVIRMLIGHGAIVREGDRWMANETISSIEIPETLHGLLLARIDQLPDAAKRSLRIASVIGRQFPVRVLERVLLASTPETPGGQA
ncbi:MAG TPA: adenylate/guanylate cyclase domain-containing protein [Candidatus Limnocylindrales bacterium]|nr:adenylate/guanylate cyclase domain-containing protein [Candidatus Limnocylindrales bacterium]